MSYPAPTKTALTTFSQHNIKLEVTPLVWRLQAKEEEVKKKDKRKKALVSVQIVFFFVLQIVIGEIKSLSGYNLTIRTYHLVSLLKNIAQVHL